ncbi:hypothetical protein [Streptococcus equi]|uniref:hypothetical protein n=1 Tax=Streptococcus equi TaxID=1336 RepID=UPI001E28F01E|nr:hypothetical protein [Streptococcus equi]MCD3373103.1 hypothetical protein [Streptococcus equi subsp. zooepidemicus]
MNAIGMYSILERLDRLEKIVFETVDDTSDILTRLRNWKRRCYNRLKENNDDTGGTH